MIRRTVQYASGEKKWLLISQVVHARLAGAIAQEWAAAPAGLEPRDQLVAAVERHEDGWAEVDRRVRIGKQTFRPLDFADVPTPQLLDIWRQSIASATAVGPLAGYMVSRHHTQVVAPMFSFRWQGDDAQAALVARFAAEQETRQSEWLSHWQAGNTALRPTEAAERAARWLRLFDELSLWLCRGHCDKTHDFDTPGGPPLTLRPHPTGQMVLSPWPFRATREVVFNAPGRAMPVARYDNPEALAAAGNESVAFRWTFVRDPNRGAPLREPFGRAQKETSEHTITVTSTPSTRLYYN